MNFESQTLTAKEFKAIWGYRVENSQLPSVADHRRGDEIEELYDLSQDPDERRNLIATHAKLFEELKAQFDELSTAPLPEARTGPLNAVTATTEAERREREEQLKSLGYLQ